MRKAIIISIIIGYLFSAFGYAMNAVRFGAITWPFSAVTGMIPQVGELDTDLQQIPYDWSALSRFYSAYGYKLAWYQNGKLTKDGRQLITAIGDARRDGMDPKQYHYDLVRATVNLYDRNPIRAELLLTDGLLRYSRDLHSGQLQSQVLDPEWHIQPVNFNEVDWLRNGLESGQVADHLQTLKHISPDYQRLSDALQSYRVLASLGGWPQMQPGPMLRPGDSHPDVPLLRWRLSVTGDYQLQGVNHQSPVYDQSLVKAVRHFQQRHGLKIDGILGHNTRAAMNVPVEQRVAQIKANLERRRWMPRNLGKRYLLVNTAAYEFSYIENGTTMLRKRVIIGRTDRTTPSFNSHLTNIVFNPSWTIPLSIAVKDMLPQQQLDISFFSEKQIQVYRQVDGQLLEQDPSTIEWKNYGDNNFPFILRQRPGPHNSVGRIKFLLPNQFSIFLHDTPARNLFGSPVRTFSSGCIRVEHPEKLAEILLAKLFLAPDAIEHLIAQGTTQYQRLTEPVPIYVAYFTVWVEAEGEVQFRPDVYGRDQPLIAAFSTPTIEPESFVWRGKRSSLISSELSSPGP